MTDNTPNTAEKPVIQTARAMLKQLQQDYPVMRDALPLAIGIDKQVFALQPEVSRKLLRGALPIHTKSLRYLKSLQSSEKRFNLDGSEAGETSPEQRELAAQTLREHFKKQAEARRAQQAAEAEAEAARERQVKLEQLAQKFAKH